MARPWMPLWIADYRQDTAHLNAAQHGAYLLLIMHYWATGALPVDDAQLARIACMTPAEWKRSRSTIAAFFDGGWKHGRVEEEIAQADVKYQKRANAGRTGGRRSAERRALNDDLPQQTNSIASSNAPAGLNQSQPQPPSDTEKNTPSEENSARDLRVKIVRAFEDAGSPSLPDTARAELWLSQGYDPGIIVAVVRELLAKKPGISSLNYFDSAIREAQSKRTAPATAVSRETPWPEWAKRWREHREWPMALGPEPGFAGCRCPEDVLRAAGIDAATGEIDLEPPPCLRRIA